MFINKVMIYGNLTRDPELRAMPSGMNVANFSLATNRVFRDRDGKKQEQAEFHNVVVFGRQADLVVQYLKKGNSAYVEGRLQTRSWDDKGSGEKRYRTEVVAENVQFGPRGSGAGSQNSYASAQSAAQYEEAESSMAGAPSSSGIEYPKEDINPDDIPF